MSLYRIIDCSERATVRAAYKLVNLQENLAKYKNHLTFLIRCRNNNVLPIGLRIHVLVDTKKAKRIRETASRSLLRERINFTRWKEELLKDTVAAEQELRSITDETTFDGIKDWSANRANKVFRDTKNRQIKKFDT